MDRIDVPDSNMSDMHITHAFIEQWDSCFRAGNVHRSNSRSPRAEAIAQWTDSALFSQYHLHTSTFDALAMRGRWQWQCRTGWRCYSDWRQREWRSSHELHWMLRSFCLCSSATRWCSCRRIKIPRPQRSYRSALLLKLDAGDLQPIALSDRLYINTWCFLNDGTLFARDAKAKNLL